ncbi:MAG: ABC transporter ATP-binding protein [Planctomycetes bacterium]|nr:ABC transporter ATP-binding protein [Planctomycetota bacterium]NOG55183.1 ABC transporter ATP-binding protein [Planctomycetota bacterium]
MSDSQSTNTMRDEEYRGRLDLKLWGRIFGHTRPYLKQVIGLGGSGILLAGVETVTPSLVGLVIDEASMNGMTGRLVTYGVLYAAMLLFMCYLIWYFIVMAGQVVTGVGFDLRRKGFERLQELSFSYYDRHSVGWLVSRLTSDCSKLSSLMPWFCLDICWGLSLLCGITTAMLFRNWQLALMVLAIVPPLCIVTAFFQMRLLGTSRNMRRTNSMITSSFNEAIMGIRTTKALVREEANLDEFQVLSTKMHDYSFRNALHSAAYLPMVITLGSLGVGLALWRGGFLYDSAAAARTLGVSDAEGTLTLGTLIAFMQYAALFYMPIQELAQRFTDVQNAQAAAERVQSLLDTVPEIQDTPEVLAAIASSNGNGDSSMPLDGGDEVIKSIEFRNVSFWYKEGESVLDNFNFRVHAGQTIALVGATGGGKSTIVSLAARFYEPCSGEVLISGVDYRERSLHWLQSNLGVVLQAPHLFSGTIRDNIRYGRLEATDAQVEEAARMVNAHEFIMEMDEGYGSEVGEGGTLLSTGQRQLVSLARAVLADPQIFIMDEATSSVDTETERLIQSAIEAVLCGRISFVIAHRLSTIQRADVILVIEAGRITEQGSHEELMNKRGRYYTLYTRQFSREREASVLESSENGRSA